MTHHHTRTKEKFNVALTSVIAALFLTGTKLAVGILTGSLGILSEALHSGLDLIAAIMTLFAVNIADKPADKNHHWGHGKVENLSALIETLLLFTTCAWIVYEAIDRLKGGHYAIEVTFWSFAVIIISIVIDFSRSRALMRVAKKHNSQALEADALHFSTDIWSSCVVIIGLIGASFNFPIADSISALIVATIVVGVCVRLGKRSIDALLDASPEISEELITQIKKELPAIREIHDIRARTAGAYTFIELNIHVDPTMSIQEAHSLSHLVESKIKSSIPNCEVHVHAEPDRE